MAGIGAGMLLLYRRRAAFDEEMLHLLLGALGAYLAAEVCFALTVDAIGPLNLAGHLLRLLAFYLFARAIVEFGVRRPYSVLFRELSSRTDELREAREYVEGLLEQAPGPILVLDAEGRITRLNRAFERLTGRSSAGLAGRVLAEVLPGIAPTVREAGDSPQGVEGTVVHRDGRVRTVLWTAATLREPDGTVAATVVQGQDVTARVEAERRLRAAIDELEVSNEGLERYAYVASHDLQEPIRTVVSHVQLLQRRYGDRLDEDADEILGYIVEGGLRMQRLVQDLLLLSRIGAKKRPFEPVDVEQVLLDVLRDHRHQIRELGAAGPARPPPRGLRRSRRAPARLRPPAPELAQVPLGRAAADQDHGRTRGRVVALLGRGQRDRDRARVLRPDLRALSAPSHARAVRGNRDRSPDRQEGGRAARRPVLGRVDAGRGRDLLLHPPRRPCPPVPRAKRPGGSLTVLPASRSGRREPCQGEESVPI